MIAIAKTRVAARLASVLLLSMTATVDAQNGGVDLAKGQKMLVEPVDLEKQLNEPNLRILDVRSKREYAAGHIPGAVLVDLAAWRNLGTSHDGLHDSNAWGEKIGQVGIRKDSQVVVYGGALPDTARVWWLLKYAGVNDVAILNGGWQSWSQEGRARDKSVPEIDETDFKPDFQADRLEEIGSLKESATTGKVRIVDTRSDGEYTGQTVRGQRGGHIPGAVHLEWNQLVASDGRFNTTSELRELFRQRNILPSEPTVCY